MTTKPRNHPTPTSCSARSTTAVAVITSNSEVRNGCRQSDPALRTMIKTPPCGKNPQSAPCGSPGGHRVLPGGASRAWRPRDPKRLAMSYDEKARTSGTPAAVDGALCRAQPTIAALPARVGAGLAIAMACASHRPNRHSFPRYLRVG